MTSSRFLWNEAEGNIWVAGLSLDIIFDIVDDLVGHNILVILSQVFLHDDIGTWCGNLRACQLTSSAFL